MDQDLVLQRLDGAAPQLMLLFHGVGATPHDLAPLGIRLAAAYPQACIVSVAGASADGRGGFQWFSIDGVDEDNRPQRVAQALPAFAARIADWQAATSASVEATALIGFSQGAIMALAAACALPPVAGRVVAIGGRFAALPEAAPRQTTLHLLHGKHDPVMPYRHTVEAAHHLVGLGADVTADVIPFVGHEIGDEIVDTLLERLQTHLPQRRWDEAMRAAAQAPGRGDG